MVDSILDETNLPSPELDKGEKIIWSGQPDPKVNRAHDLIMVLPGLLFLCSSIIFWIYSPQQQILQGFSVSDKIIVLAIQDCLFLPLFLIGIYAVTKPFFDYQKKRRTWFILSNKRALVIYSGSKRFEKSCQLVKPLKTTKINTSEGRGIIIFDDVPDKNLLQRLIWHTPIKGEILGTLVFYDIQSVDNVQSLIENCINENACPIAANSEKTKDSGLMFEISKLNKRLAIALLAVIAISLAITGFVVYQINQLTPLEGYIDKSGNMVIQPRFHGAESFQQGLAQVCINGKWGFIDRTGKMIIAPKFDEVQSFANDFAAAKLKHKWGYIDKAGDWKIAPQYIFAGPFADGLAAVRGARDHTAGRFIDKNNKTVFLLKDFYLDESSFFAFDFEPRPPGFSEGLLAVCGQKNDSFTGFRFIDEHGKFVIKAHFDQARFFSQGLAPVQLQEKWGFINKQGKFVIAARFENALPFSEGLAAVRVANKWGFINCQGKQIIVPRFDGAEPFCEGLARVLMDSRQGLIDNNGRVVVERKICGGLHEGLAAASAR